MLMQEIIDTIYSWWEDISKPERPFDGLKFGSLDKECTGIMVTWQSTSAHLARAAEEGLNLVLTHEGVLWEPHGVVSHGQAEIPTEDKPGNQPRLIACRDGELSVYRVHDSLDLWRVHGIIDQWISFLGLPEASEVAPIARTVVLDTPIRTAELAEQMRTKHGLDYVRVSGPTEKMVSRLGVLVGAFAWVPTIDLLLAQNPDVVLVGEIREVEGLHYLDELDIPCIMVGHCASEEPGLQHFAEYLGEQFPDIPVRFYPCPDPPITVVS